MRISTEKGDRAYIDHETAKRVRIWLNGQEIIGRCLTADEELGFMRLLVLDARGNLIPIGTPPRAKTMDIRGTVRIEILPDNATDNGESK